MKGIEQFVQVDAATLGALKYAGTWNASTNTPTLASGVGVQGQYYVVSVAGSTNLDGETNWQVGDWAVFNGSVWQKVDGGSTSLLTTLTVTGNTYLATTSGDVGIGTSSPANKLHVSGTGSTPTLFERTGANGVYLQLKDVSGASVFLGADNGLFAVQTPGSSYSNKLVVDSSGNVGIGTSSPGAKLHSLATTNPAIFASSDATALFTTYQYNTSTVCGYIGNGAGVVTGAGASNFGVRAENSLVFAAGGNNERMRLDSSGNLGLGVTPSAWSTQNAVEFSYGAFSAGTAIGTLMASNAFYNGTNWIYRISSAAMRYTQDSAGHSWFTAPSGTAGNAISFTQAMTLDNGGRLLLNRTDNADNSFLQIRVASSATRQPVLSATNAVDASFFVGLKTAICDIGTGSGALALYADNTERARIDTSGNLSIGQTSSALQSGGTGITLYGSSASEIKFLNSTTGSSATDGTALVASGSDFIINNRESGAVTFGTSNTERARIDSSGNLLVGTTTNTYSSKLVSNSGITDFGSQYNVNTSSGDYQFVQRAANRGLAFYVDAAGTIATLSSAGVWTDASDVRYKENVQPTRYGLDAVMQLKPREYNLIGQSKKQVGFIAQEVLDVVPEVVDSVVNSITNEDRYTLSYGQMTAVLTKAIQELKAQNDELRARVAALETK